MFPELIAGWEEYADVTAIDYYKPELNTIEKIAAHCAKEIAKLNPDQPLVLATQSYGGFFIQELMGKLEEVGKVDHVKAISMIESLPFQNPPTHSKAQCQQLLDMLLAGKRGGDDDALKKQLTLVFQDYWEKNVVEEDIVKDRIERMVGVGIDTFIAHYAAIAKHEDNSSPDRLSLFTMPFLSIVGDKSTFFGKGGYAQTINKWRGKIPSERFACAVIENGHHILPITHPREIVDIMQVFLNRVDLVHAPSTPNVRRNVSWMEFQA